MFFPRSTSPILPHLSFELKIAKEHQYSRKSIVPSFIDTFVKGEDWLGFDKSSCRAIVHYKLEQFYGTFCKVQGGESLAVSTWIEAFVSEGKRR